MPQRGSAGKIAGGEYIYMATIAGSDSPVRHSGISAVALRWSSRALVATVWISSGIFGIYVLALFLGAIAAGAPEDWNTSLPRLYVEHALAANLGIGVHFALGAVLLLLGPIQLMTSGHAGRVSTAGPAGSMPARPS